MSELSRHPHVRRAATNTAWLAWPLYAGMAVSASAAVVASASTLAALAHEAGWSGWTPWLLPAALDVGGAVGGWCWLRPGVAADARRLGRLIAVAGAIATLVGNAVGHLIASQYLTSGPVLVIVVGATPAAVLVSLAHLAASLTPTDAGELVEAEEHGPGHSALVAGNESAPRLAVEPVGQFNSSAIEVDTKTALLTAVTRRPRTVAELVRITGRSRTTVMGHLRSMTAGGEITRDASKRYQRSTAKDAATD